jgi:hypothetical protein
MVTTSAITHTLTLTNVVTLLLFTKQNFNKMKVTYDILRKIKTNSTVEFKGTPLELNSARVNTYYMNNLHPEEGRHYTTRTDYKKGSIFITATESGKKLVEVK